MVDGILSSITHAAQNLVAISTITRKYCFPHILRSIPIISLNSLAKGIHTTGLLNGFLYLMHVIHLLDMLSTSFSKFESLIPALFINLINVLRVGCANCLCSLQAMSITIFFFYCCRKNNNL